MIASRAALTLAAITVVTGVGRTAPLVSGNKDRRVWSARSGVGVEAPPGWTLSLGAGYPNVLALLVHPSGSRISITVDRTDAADAAALVEQNRSGYAAERLTIDRTTPGPLDGVWLDARAPDRKQSIRQLYIVRRIAEEPGAEQAIVLTLTTPDLAAAAGALDWTVAHLELTTPAPPEGAKADPEPRDGGR